MAGKRKIGGRTPDGKEKKGPRAPDCHAAIGPPSATVARF